MVARKIERGRTVVSFPWTTQGANLDERQKMGLPVDSRCWIVVQQCACAGTEPATNTIDQPAGPSAARSCRGNERHLREVQNRSAGQRGAKFGCDAGCLGGGKGGHCPRGSGQLRRDGGTDGR